MERFCHLRIEEGYLFDFFERVGLGSRRGFVGRANMYWQCVCLCISLTKWQFFVTTVHGFRGDKEKTWKIINRPALKSVRFLRKQKGKQFFFVGTTFWQKMCFYPNCPIKLESPFDKLFGLRQIVFSWSLSLSLSIYIYIYIHTYINNTYTESKIVCELQWLGNTTLTLGRQDKSIKVRVSEKKSTPADISAFNSAHVRNISWTPVPLDYIFSLFVFHFVFLF